MSQIQSQKTGTNLGNAYSEIAYRHKQLPFLRIGQFWMNFMAFVEGETGHDIFYMSDSELLTYMSRYIESHAGKKDR